MNVIDEKKSSMDSYTSSLELPELANTRDSESINLSFVPHLDPINPFAFSALQLCQVVNQKNLDFIKKVGGIQGISKGLHSNIHHGLVWNEDNLPFIRMYDLIHPKKEQEVFQSQIPLSMDCDTFVQRRQIFGSNVLPQIEQVTLLQLMWQSFQDKTLVTCTSIFYICAIHF